MRRWDRRGSENTDFSSGPDELLIEVVHKRSAAHPDRRLFTFLRDGETEEESCTYGELWRAALAIAARLGERCATGERALLLFPPGLDFIRAFFGCLAAGVVAVPAYPPRPGKPNPRLRSILEDARPRLVLAPVALAARKAALAPHLPGIEGLDWLAVDSPPAAGTPTPGATAFWPRGGDLAFLQYTSGSTSSPKGVMVTHRNLVHNQEQIRTAFGMHEGSVVVGWLPLYHDMGLIGNVLQPLYAGASCVLMSPLAFLKRPRRWLEAIARYRATTSGGPNFAYELAVSKIPPEEREGLDLSSWTLAFNGAEPVRAATIERFAEAFAPCGFRRHAFYPCYGLAEATLFVSGREAGRGAEVKTLDARALERDQALPAAPGAEPRELVSCGKPWLDGQIVIVHPETLEPCAGGQVGEIWVASESVAAGYWGRPEETAASFGARLAGSEAGYLRTGDLGFLDQQGELFLTGRAKDLIILRGRNHYPQDLELTVEQCHAALRRGCGAAFGVDVLGEERLVVVQEIEPRAAAGLDLGAVALAIREAVSLAHELQIEELVLALAGEVPKTSSGKIQRRLCRALYLAGRLARVTARLTAEPADTTRWQPPSTAEVKAAAADRAACSRLAAAWVAGRLLAFAQPQVVWTAAPPLTPELSLAALGLDSLAAVELSAAARAELGVELPLAWVLEAPSLAAVADHLATALAAAPAGEAAEELRPLSVAGEHPLSWSQQALWVLHRLAPSNAAYNIVAAVRVEGSVDTAALARAWARLVARHGALTTTFAEGAAGPVQRVGTAARPEIRIEGTAGRSAEELEALRLEFAYRPFDLERGPLVRLLILQADDGAVELVLAVHHIVADFWSLALLGRELGALYVAELGGDGGELPAPAPLAYVEAVHRGLLRLSGPAGERALAAARARLGASPPRLDLPADHPRPAVRRFAGAVRRLRLEDETAMRLAALAAAAGTSTFVPLLVGFQTLLQRLCGARDLVVGAPAAGRLDADLSGVVGYFVNTLLLAARHGSRDSYGTAIAAAKGEVAAALADQDLPLPYLASRLGGGAAGEPPADLVQVLFVFQKLPPGLDPGLAGFALGEAGCHVRLGALRLESLALPERRAQFDLTLAAGEIEGRIHLALHYDVDLWDATSAERLLLRLGRLLEEAAARPERPLGELDLSSAAERHQLQLAWNDTALPAAASALHLPFEEQAGAAPEAIALLAHGEAVPEAVSYGELEARSSRLARRLQDLGVGLESRVGLLAERSPRLIVGLLAVLRAGGAFVPLAAGAPAERLRFQVEDAGLEVVLTDRALAGRLAGGVARLLALEPSPAGPRHRAVALPGEAAAYCIYTSGSTGRPKAVINSHAGIANRLLWSERAIGLTSDDRVLGKTPHTFDVAVPEIFWPLGRGACLVLAKPGGHLDPADLVGLAAAERITAIHFVASMLDAFLDAAADADLGALRLLFSSGEAVLAPSFRRAAASLPGLALWDLYGPTEAAVEVTAQPFEPGRPGAAVPIGRPIDNLGIHLVDATFRTTPIGVPGELLIAGAGVARGYLGRPGQTAERFLPDPFAARPGARLFRSGDLARRLADGAIDFLGRLDQQVKIRGVRIELGEIEAALRELPEVAEAVALVIAGRLGQGELGAYLVVAAGAALPSVAALRAALARSLPEALVPWHFATLAALPLTASGKVDRKALPAFTTAAGGGGAAPRDELEALLAGIEAELLGLSTVGREESFFALGGHSLLLTRLASRVRETCGVDLELREVFAAPTVAELARAVRAARRPSIPLTRPARPLRLPLSFAQERLWFLDRLEPSGNAYLLPAALGVEGELDLPRLQAAFAAVRAQHEALRTTFHLRQGVPEQLIHAACPFPLPLVDLSGLPDGTRRRLAETLSRHEAGRGFDLERELPLRARALRLARASHRLLVTQHHSATDGWSLGLLAGELTRAYAGEELASPAWQAADYALWQREILTGEMLERELGALRAELEGAPVLLELPADRPRPLASSLAAGEVRAELAPELVAALDAWSAGQGQTRFTTLLAAWGALLGRLAGQEDLLVGTPVSGRTARELEGTIGLFVNTLAIRIEPRPALSFVALAGAVRGRLLTAQDHQQLPFERLVEALVPGRSLARSPLIQVLVSYVAVPPSVPVLGAAEVTPIPLPAVAAKLDLDLELTPRGAGLEALAVFAAELFDATTIARWLGHFRVLLAAALSHPGRALSGLPLLSAEERRQILDTWCGQEFPSEAPLLPLAIAAQAAAAPEALALAGLDEQLSYGEMLSRARSLAAALVSLGVGPEVAVGLCQRRAPELYVSLLAVLEAGGYYVPFDRALPGKRIAEQLTDCGAAAVLADGTTLSQVPEGPWRVLSVGAVPASRALPRRRELDRENLVYAIYTSGSTGRPKGVGVTHGGLARFVAGAGLARLLGAGDRVLQFASLSFDVSVEEIFCCFARGATLVPRRDEIESAGATLAFCAERGVTALDLPTAFWHEVVRHLDGGGTLPPRLKVVVSGGEAAQAEAVSTWQARVGSGVALINSYGPTEITVAATEARLESWPAAPGRRVPIGRPIAGASAWVLDGSGLDLAPPGVPGELALGGRAVARGYLGRPGATAERFRPDPFSAAPGARLYLTGDLARWLKAGELEFLGRRDHQVKVRGYRVELPEIEAALSELPAVSQAVAVVAGAGSAAARLVAYVVPASGVELDAADLRLALAARLPEFMLPAAFVALAALPLTVTGKLDRRALPAPSPEAPEGSGASAALSPVGQLLATLWSEALGGAAPTPGSDFFALGGHSLAGMRMMARAEAAFGVELPLRLLFEAPTLTGLAAEIEMRLAPGHAPPPPLTPLPAAAGTELELSAQQERLWFLAQLEPRNPAYNLVAALRLTGRLERSALARAFTQLARRHAALRTTFSECQGRPRQRVAPHGIVPLAMVEVAAASEPAEAARRLALAAARRPFDLSSGPLLRALLLAAGEGEHWLVINLHHIIADGWSLDVLTRELGVLYAAALAGTGAALPVLPITYGDYAAWQLEWLASEGFGARLAACRARLAGAPLSLALPADRPRRTEESLAGAVVERRLEAPLTARLGELARARGASLFMVLLAGFEALVARSTGARDFLVGTPVANRGRVELEGLVGLLVNTLVLRATLEGDPTGLAWLDEVRRAAIAAYAQAEVPFERLVAELARERNLGQNPLVQVMFGLVGAPLAGLELPGLRVCYEELPTATAKMDLTLTVVEEEGSLRLVLEHATHLFDRTTAERLLARYATLLAFFAARPEARLSALPVLTATELHQLRREWNDTVPPGPCPFGPTLDGAVATRAALTPEAVAFLFAEEHVSCQHLDRGAGRLAATLRRLGAGRGTVVGIALERSAELLPAVLAVLRAGAAYVPIDPAYPRARREVMLEDSGAGLVLTTSLLAADLAPFAGRALPLDRLGDELAAEPLPRIEGLGEDLAYLLFTSGSTGRPKGVEVPHAALLNFLAAMAERPGLGADDRLLAVTSLSFDIAGLELFLPLLVGARLEIAGGATVANGPALAAHLAKARITVLQATPSTWKLLLEAGYRGGVRPLCGGEALPQKLAQDLLALPETVRGAVWNLYGPTETTIWSAVEPVGEGRLEPVTVGRPIRATTITLLDRQGLEVPLGAAGEVVIGGLGVARGYRGRPGQTAERFRPDFVAARPGTRRYHTGDLGRLLADGRLEVLGRADQQVKLRGHRIEVAEIEHALLLHPMVAAAVVALQPGLGGEPVLVAYFVARGEMPPAEELRRHLRQRLPEYMLPAAFVALAALPLTPNGKVDRRALPALAAPRATAAARLPANDTERAVAAAWEEVLGLAPGREESFFDLGGHSLLLLRVHRRLEAELVRAIPLTELFRHPTVATLAQYLAAEKPAERSLEQSFARAAKKLQVRLPPPRLERRGRRA